MAVNKVVYGDDTLIDLTSDTVTADSLLLGATAHTASGEAVTGTADYSPLVINATSLNMTTGTGTVDTAASEGIAAISEGRRVVLNIGGQYYIELTVASTYYLQGIGVVDDETMLVLIAENTLRIVPVYVAGSNITINKNTINATVPTKTSDLTNDSGFLTSHQSLDKYATTDTLTALSQTVQGIADAANTYMTETAPATYAAISHTHSELEPLAQATYEGVIATANNQAGATFWLGEVHPDSFTAPYHIRYELYVTNAGRPSDGDYQGSVDIYGSGNGRQVYAITNSHHSTSYRSIYYHTWASVSTAANMEAGYGHIFGVSLQSSYSPTSSSYKRTITVKVTECDGCTAELYEPPYTYSGRYSSTIWGSISQYDAYNNGLRETGDDNSIDRLYLNSYVPTASSSQGMYANELVLSGDGGATWFSICSNRVTTTSSVATTLGFLPSHIMYYNSGTTISAGKTAAASTLYQSLPFNLAYSMPTATYTAYKPVFLKCTYSTTDGLLYVASSGWIAQALPTEDDGYVYVYLGQSYSTTNIDLQGVHPMYVHDGSKVREVDMGDLEAEYGTY